MHRILTQAYPPFCISQILPGKISKHTGSRFEAAAEKPEAVPIFFPKEIDKIFNTNDNFRELLRKFVFDCKCNDCEKYSETGMEHLSLKSRVLAELLERPNPGTETSQNKEVFPTTIIQSHSQEDGISKDSATQLMDLSSTRRNKRVLFIMLCYMKFPLLIFYPKLWEGFVANFERDSVKYELDKSLLFAHFKHLGSMEKAGSAIQSFINTFWKTVNQFNPLAKFSNPGGTVPENAVFPFREFTRIGKGGQGDVFSFKIPREYREYLDIKFLKAFPEDTEFFACKIVSLAVNLPGAENERKGMQYIQTLNHPNLIKLLFWYDHMCKRYFILPRYVGNLDQFLRNPNDDKFKAFSQLEAPPYLFPTSSKLWKGMLGILDGLKQFHNPPAVSTGDPSRGGTDSVTGELIQEQPTEIGAHLDLKPSNILLTDSGDMVLSDFGTSRVKKGNVTTQSQAGTEAYLPPEKRGERRRSNQSLDVWSMACILLEVVVFITQKNSVGYQSFQDARSNESPDGSPIDAHDCVDRNYSFWCYELPDSQEFRLKKSVSEHLNKAHEISKLHGDHALFRIIRQLRIMFSFEPDSRGSIAECISNFEDESIRPPSQGLTQRSRSIDSPAGTEELGYLVPDSSNPLSLSRLTLYLKYEDEDSSSCDEIPITLNIFKGLEFESDKLHLKTEYRYRDEIVSKEVEGSRRDGRLIAYRLGSSGRALEWRFSNMKLEYCFQSRDYTSFFHVQQALTGYKCVPGTYFLLRSCFISVSKTQFPETATASIEVWVEQSPKEVRGNPVTRPREQPKKPASFFSSMKSSWSRASTTTVAGSSMDRHAWLVIFRKFSDKDNLDCVFLKNVDSGSGSRSKRISKACINPIGKHRRLKYCQIGLGTQEEPMGLPIQERFLDEVYTGKSLHHAAGIGLEFKCPEDLAQLRAAFMEASLEKYFP